MGDMDGCFVEDTGLDPRQSRVGPLNIELHVVEARAFRHSGCSEQGRSLLELLHLHYA